MLGGPTPPRFLDPQVRGGAWKPAFLTRSQVMASAAGRGHALRTPGVVLSLNRAGVTGRVNKSVNNDTWLLPPGILISLRHWGFFPVVLPRPPSDQQSLETTGLGDTLNSENR